VMEKVLITGADGFVASHLTGELERETGWEIHGIGLKQQPSSESDRLAYTVLDITDFEALCRYVEEVRPHGVFHLAAQPSVALSWEDPWKTYEVNIVGQLNLLEALTRLQEPSSIHIACSSEEYGVADPSRMPMDEATPLEPCSHYAVSKVGQEVLGLLYRRAFGWRVMITRSFNQAGPGQSSDFVEIEAGRLGPVIKVGNLEARRDFTDVRDTVRAYRLLMEKGTGGTVYNVCSGEAHAISDILGILLSLSPLEIEVERDPGRQRPSDLPILVGDNSRIGKDLGWSPRLPIEETLQDTLDWWRRKTNIGRTSGPDVAGGDRR